MTTSRCANPWCRRGAEPDPVYGAEVICGYCTDRAERQLHELAAGYDALVLVLAAGGAGSARFDHVNGSKMPPVPVRLEAAEHRNHIRHLLASWTGLVVDERHGSRWPDQRPRALAGYLASHLDWLQTHPAAGELCAEIAQAVAKARRLVAPPAAAVRVPCPDPYNVACTGRIPVQAARNGKKARDEGDGWVRCGRCGYETDDLHALGKLLRAGETGIVTAAEACHRLRREGIVLKPATIRQWACRGKIHALDHDHAGRVLYDIDQIRSTAHATNRHTGTSRDAAVS